MLLVDRLNRESRALLRDEHAFERGVVFERLQRDFFAEFLDERDVDPRPAWVLLLRFRIEVGAFPIELRIVGVGLARDPADSGDAGGLCIRMVKEREVALRHIAHEVPSLVVAHTLPGLRAVALEIVDRVDVWLAFHEPELHASFRHRGTMAHMLERST